MTKRDGLNLKMDSTILYCCMAALIGFVINAESHRNAVDTRLAQLERRTDTLEADLKSIKESLYEIRSNVKLLVQGK